jgi:hypothetical protein
MRDQAIINTHPSVARVVADTDAYDVNGNSVALDQAVIDTETSRLEREQANAIAQKAADKQSAHDKLSVLGLTDAEITALTGGA